MLRVYPDAGAKSIDVRSGTAWVLSYSRMLSPANWGTIHSVESLARRCTQKSMSVRLPSCTSPSSPGSPRPLAFASFQKRNPDCAALTSSAETSTLRASGRGVSCHSADHRLSYPSTLIADTPKQRGTPFVSRVARNSSDTVVPSRKIESGCVMHTP